MGDSRIFFGTKCSVLAGLCEERAALKMQKESLMPALDPLGYTHLNNSLIELVMVGH